MPVAILVDAVVCNLNAAGKGGLVVVVAVCCVLHPPVFGEAALFENLGISIPVTVGVDVEEGGVGRVFVNLSVAVVVGEIAGLLVPGMGLVVGVVAVCGV